MTVAILKPHLCYAQNNFRWTELIVYLTVTIQVTCAPTNEEAKVTPDHSRIPAIMIHLRLERSPRYPNNREKIILLTMNDDCSSPACELFMNRSPGRPLVPLSNINSHILYRGSIPKKLELGKDCDGSGKRFRVPWLQIISTGSLFAVFPSLFPPNVDDKFRTSYKRQLLLT